MARILIIEDNAANRELMGYLLGHAGHEIVTACDGDEGVVRARDGAPAELIVCDIHLPGLDGYGVARAIRETGRLAHVPLVAVTALAMVGDREKVLAAGFDGYIAKPIRPREFAAEVAAYLGTAPVPGAVPAAAGAVAGDQAPAVAARAAVKAPTGPRVLVVDDSPTNGDLVRAILEPFGYRVDVVTRVAAATDALARARFDLIISDVHMPNASGLELLADTKADPRFQHIPFLIVSSSAWGMDTRDSALAMGAARYLVRPLAARDLVAHVAACLQPAPEH